MAEPIYDVAVVGSGPGGGIATYVLAKAGLKVALVEAGLRLKAGVDYGHHDLPWEVAEERITKGIGLPFDSVWRFAARNHFTGVGDRPNHGMLVALGGRSLCWAGHSLRFGPKDYESWPIPYEQVAPHYSRAEKFMGVYGFKDGLSNMPDGEFLKGVPYRPAERALWRGVEKLKAGGARMEFVAQRKAMLTEPHSSRRAQCHFCGMCSGCCVDAKYTSANTPLPLAERTGNLTIITGAWATRILMKDGRAAGIEYAMADGNRREVRSKSLVLACNSIETPRLMLHSGVGNSSGQVGRNLTSHFGCWVYGFFPEFARRNNINDDGTNYHHSLLTGLNWDKPNPRFQGTYQVQCGSGWPLGTMPIRDVKGWGKGFKKELRERNLGNVGMNMQGSLIQSPKKFMDLDPAVKDRNGVPLPRVHLHYEDNDVAMADDMVETCERIIRAAGGQIHSSPGKMDPSKLIIDYNHWVGTVRMGTDRRTSPLDTWGRSYDVPNLFVGDASVFPAYPEKNPVLTNITLSWRMSEHLAALAKKGELA
jgi:choline dehydrogenase-like flavoprotein